MTNVESLCCREPLPDWAPYTLRVLRAITRLAKALERRRWERAFADAQAQLRRLGRIDHRFERDIFFD